MQKIILRTRRYRTLLQFRRFSFETENPHWYKPQIGLETGIYIYNTIARRKVPVILPNEHYITWYTCGPTVYDSSHLGHASCYVKLDIIQRILRNHFHYNLVTAMNITDIDDKIIRRSEETGKDWREISRHYETEFWSDMHKLGVSKPDLKLRVTDHIPEIIAFIKNIMSNSFAYVGNDRSVYFDVRKFPLYGKLQKVNLNVTENAETSIESNTDKFTSADFALWKAKKTENEPSWNSPWGHGRPGWHIECSTLASMVFGRNIDFHAGGLDLRFPHHENEEAQCCVYHNTKQWITYWLHTGQLNTKGQLQKMSKSLKNTIPIRDMLKQYTADEFRMACALSNYRNSVEYSDEVMTLARNNLKRLKSFQFDCQAYLSGKKQSVHLEASTIINNLSFAKSQLDACYKDDFDTARAINILLEQASNLSRSINVTNANGNLITGNCLDAVAAVKNFISHSLNNMGFSTTESNETISNESSINVEELLEDILQSRMLIRNQAISSKSRELFDICDQLRNCLKQHGIEILDHNSGSSWKFQKK